MFGLGVILLSPCQVQARRVKVVAQAHAYHVLRPNERLFPPPFIYPGQTLVEDENGKAFIVLDKDPRYDYLAHLLGRDLFNVAEVRIVKANEVIGSELYDWMSQRGLSEVGISRLAQDYSYEELPRQNNSLEALFVFWIFLRDSDHGFDQNLYYLLCQDNTRVYISFDHGMIGFFENHMTREFLWPTNLPGYEPYFIESGLYRVIDADTLMGIAHQSQEYYTDEKLEAIVQETGFGKDILEVLKSRRDSLVEDTVTFLKHLGYLKP